MAGRVLVIGRGLAGSMAALAARQAGAEVTVAARAYGRTALCSGLIGLAAAPHPKEPLPLDAAVLRLLQRNARHPYGRFADPVGAIDEAVRLFLDATGDLYRHPFDPDSPPLQFPNEIGTVTRAHLGPVTFARLGRPSDGEALGIVAFDDYPRFRADFMARAWSAFHADTGETQRFKVLRTTLNSEGRLLAHPVQAARLLEDDTVLTLVAERLKRALDGTRPPLLIFPPVLGLTHPDVAAKLEERLEVPVREAAAAQASLPGLRLINRLTQALAAAGIDLQKGEVAELDTPEAGPLNCRLRDHSGQTQTLSADAVVLATGKFLGGGIVARNRRFSEPIAQAPLMLGGRRVEEVFMGRLTDVDFALPQRFARVGVSTDEQGRILGIKGHGLHPRLFAAGQLLADFDPFMDGCAEGVDLATGWLAGRSAALAAEEVTA